MLKSLDLSPALGAAVLVPDPPASGVAETTSAEQARHASQRRSLNQ